MTEKVKPAGKINKRKTLPQLFKKGQSGNPKGRPPDCERVPEVFMLKEALRKVEKETGIAFLEVFVRMAYKHKEVAIALAKKLIPDKIQGEGFEKSTIVIQIYRPEIYELKDVDAASRPTDGSV